MPEKVLEGKRAIVTGASSGIGSAIAVRYAAAGADVWCAGGGDAEGLRNTIQGCTDHGAKADGKGYDLSNARRAADIVRDGSKFLGGLDILVNCAGTRNFDAFVDIPDDEVDRLFEVNAKAAFVASREAARLMTPQERGHILMIGSDAGEHGVAGFTLYAATKAAMHSLTRSLALELGPKGLRVNCLAPGPVASGRVKKLLDTDPEFAEGRRNKIPIRIFGNPENIAATALFMVSPENEFMNGAVVSVDGGITAA